MTTDNRSQDSWSARVEHDAEEAENLLHAASDLADVVRAVGRVVKRHHLAHDQTAPGSDGAGADRPTWGLSIFNAGSDIAFAAIAAPDRTGDLRVLGWLKFLPGRQSFWNVATNPFGQVGLMACSADAAYDLFADQPRRLPVAVPLVGPIPDTMRFTLRGWHGRTEPAIRQVRGPESCLVDVGCLMKRVDPDGSVAFEIPGPRGRATL